MTDVRQLRVFVTEEHSEQHGRVPKVCELEVPVGVTWQDLNEAIAEVVLGPEDSRWTKVHEKRCEDLNPDTGGGSITVTSTWASQQLRLWTHPHEDCAPCRSVTPQEMPPSISLYHLLAPDTPASQELSSEAVLADWWAAMPRGRNALRPLLLRRLVSKVSVPKVYLWLEARGEGEEAHQMERKEPVPQELREKIVAEGVKGLWELCSEKEWAMRLNTACLQALIDTLNGDLLNPMELAARAVWSLSALAVPRAALVQMGVIEALFRAAELAVNLRSNLEKFSGAAKADTGEQQEGVDAAHSSDSTGPRASSSPVALGVTLELLNRVVHACLGALALLAVDSGSRQAALKISSSLDLLLRLADLTFLVPEPVLPPMLPMSLSTMPSHFDQPADGDGAPKDTAEGPGTPPAEKEAATTAGRQSPDASTAVQASAKESSSQQCSREGSQHDAAEPPHVHVPPSAFMAGMAVDGEHSDGSCEGATTLPEHALAPEDDPLVHQQLAAEILWSMAGRDREVRASLAKWGALPRIMSLAASSNQGVAAPATLCLAAYAHDAGPASSTDTATQGDAPAIEVAVTDSLGAAMTNLAVGHEQYDDMCAALSKHVGVKMLVDSGQAYHLINALATRLQELLDMYCDGETHLTPDHPVLPVLEAAATAMRVAVAAQLVQEQQAAIAAAAAPRPPDAPSPQRPLSAVELKLGAGPKPAAPTTPPVPPLQPLGWRSVSKLARLTGQAVALLQSAQETEQQNQRGQMQTGSFTGEGGDPEHLQEAAGGLDEDVASLTGSLFCLMSSLAAVHTSPLLLRRVHDQLHTLVAAIEDARLAEAEALNTLEAYKEEVTVKRQTSKFYYYEDDEAETERLEKVLEEREQHVDALLEKRSELEDSLQAASEESVAVAQDGLRCLVPAHPHVGAAQLAAAAVLSAMSQASHPTLQASLEDPSQVFKGPFRSLILESHVLSDLMDLAQSNCCNCQPLADHTRILVANAVTHLVASEEPLSPHLLVACCAYLMDSRQPETAEPHLAAALWCLARHEDNRRGMLTEGSWTPLLAKWLRRSLRVVRQSHALLQGLQGFFLPDQAMAGTDTSATSLTSAMARLDEAMSSLAEDVRLEVGQELTAAVSKGEAGVKQVRFCLMALWLMLRQWLVEHMSPMNTLTNSEGLHVRSNTSWWTLKFSIDTPLPLTQPAQDALALLAQVAAGLPDTDGSPSAQLRELALRSAWNLSVTHPVVSARLVELGMAQLLTATIASRSAGSRLIRTAIAYMMHLTTLPEHVPALGGLINVCQLLCSCMERALSTQQPGEAGVGVDVELLEDSVRGLAKIGLSQEGRAALKQARAIRWLVAVVRVDNEALEAVIQRRQDLNIPVWDKTSELLCPLRAINNIPITLATDQSLAARDIAIKAMHEAGITPPPPPACGHTPDARGGSTGGSSSSSRVSAVCSEEDVVVGATPRDPAGKVAGEAPAVCGDAEVGLMALWGLLNLSGYAPAQVALCRHGLYTLLRAVHRSVDPLRSSTAAAVLANIHFHPDNATTLYKAELKLKHAALLQLQGMSSSERPGTADGPPSPQPSSPSARHRAASGRRNSQRPASSRHSTGAVPHSSVTRPGTAGSSTGADQTRSGTSVTATVRLANAGVTEAIAAIQELDTRRTASAGGAGPGNGLQSPTAPTGSTPVSDAGQGPVAGGASAGGSEAQGGGLAATGASDAGVVGSQLDEQAEAERAFQETRMSFLQWVVDPGAQAFAALDELSRGNLGRQHSLSQDELFSRLTQDPEEVQWMRELQRLQDVSDFRHAQGSFLRGTFSRSLAEGAASLWHVRKTSKHPSHPSHPSRPGTPSSCKSSSQPHSHSHPATQRPGTAPPRSQQQGHSHTSHKHHSQPHHSNKTASGGTRAANSNSNHSKSKSRTKPFCDAIDKPGCDAWRPHILAFVQEHMDKPQVYLAQRLLVAATPKTVVNTMTGLAVKLFGNKVLTEGIKAMEERAAAEEAFKAAVEQAAKEERERMEAEARVLDIVRFDSANSKTSRGSRMGGLSRAVSMAVARSAKREQSRAASRSVSRAVSRAVSRRVSVALASSSSSGRETPRTASTAAAMTAPAATGKKALRAARPAGGGVRFGEEVDGGSTTPPLPANGLLATNPETDAALAAAAAALLNAGRTARGDAGDADNDTNGRKTGASFIAGTLVQAGALSSLPTVAGGGVRGAGSAAARAAARKAASAEQEGGRHLSRNASRASQLAGRDAALTRSLTRNGTNLEAKWLGEDVRRSLARPLTGYHRPHLGPASPAGMLVSRLKSERYQELQDMLYPERAKLIRPVKLDDNVARPEAVLNATVEDVVTLGALRDAVASAGNLNRDLAEAELNAAEADVSDAMPLSVRVATGDGGPDKVYRFPRDTLYDPRHIVLFQHIEGAIYCQSLYGHYLLPNGKLAHFVLGDTVRKGHQVDLEPPPDIPFSPDDWLMDALPTTTVFTDWVVPQSPTTRSLLAPLWCPVPALGAAPQESVIEWQDGVRGGNLVLKSVCLSATLARITRVDTEVTQVEPTVKKGKKKPPAAGGAPAPGTPSPAAPARPPARR